MIGIKEIAFFVVVLLANIIQCITGFAGTVLAMPFSLMLVGYDVAKPTLNLLGIVASIGVLITNRKGLNVKEFVKIISIMLVGIVAGFAISLQFSMNGGVIYKLLGGIVLLFMLLGCYNTFVKKDSADNELSTPKSIVHYLVLITAGLVHGMFVCGGPLLVIYASQRLKDRQEFRVTLSAVWIVLNSIIMFSDIHSGYYNPRLLVIIAISVAVLLGAIAIGNFVASKLNYKVFMIITYVLMGISGISLIIK